MFTDRKEENLRRALHMATLHVGVIEHQERLATSRYGGESQPVRELGRRLKAVKILRDDYKSQLDSTIEGGA